MSFRISQLKNYSISVFQAIDATSVAVKYIDAATIKQYQKFYKTTLTHYTIFTIVDASTNDEQVESFYIEYNIYYKYIVWDH